MKTITSKKKLIKIINNEKSLGFVRTMGAIHKGHLSLIKASKKACKRTIVSIFINKPQFNKKKDFQKYPRSIKKDTAILEKNNVDYLFVPKMKQMYPNGTNKKIKIISFSKKLCGEFRPGHFEAIVDIVDRFIEIIKPKKIFLGEKDMQQLIIIKSFVKYKYPKIQIIGCKTIREKNGVALSSRNSLLSNKENIIASKIYKILKRNKYNIIKKKKTTKNVSKIILNYGVKKIDYVKVFDINKLAKPYIKKEQYRIFLAYYLGSTRLIDNL